MRETRKGLKRKYFFCAIVQRKKIGAESPTRAFARDAPKFRIAVWHRRPLDNFQVLC
jgi:hypothetical protein